MAEPAPVKGRCILIFQDDDHGGCTVQGLFHPPCTPGQVLTSPAQIMGNQCYLHAHTLGESKPVSTEEALALQATLETDMQGIVNTETLMKLADSLADVSASHKGAPPVPTEEGVAGEPAEAGLGVLNPLDAPPEHPVGTVGTA